MKNTNENIQTELIKIPQNIIDMYQIDIDACDRWLLIMNHHNALNIDYDERFKVEMSKNTCNIYNNRVCFSMWLDAQITHLTIY